MIMRLVSLSGSKYNKKHQVHCSICVSYVSPYQDFCPNYRESHITATSIFTLCGSTDDMAAIAMKVVDKTKQQMDNVSASTKQAMLETKENQISNLN